jgi:hypothetical protein
VTAWARLTWQAADPAALAADLEHRLGMSAEAGGLYGGARVLRLGDTDLDLVPWRREAPDDDPRAGGRLVFEPVELSGGADPIHIRPRSEDGLGGEDGHGGDAGAGVSNAATPAMSLAGVGWATVELDRAEAELDPWLGLAVVPGDVTEPHLGARTRTRRSMGLPGRLVVLAEPVTEGRVAASLARDGEGPCALYLEPADGLEAWLQAAVLRGVPVSAVRSGPLGPSVIIGGVPSGPHLVVVAGPGVASRVPPGGTIAS